MEEGLQSSLRKQLPTVKGLQCISVCDRDGVQIVEVHTDDLPAAAVKPIFMGTFAIASEQASKLGVGANSSIISYYSGHQVIQFNYLPLVLTFIATSDANTGSKIVGKPKGMLFSLEEDLRDQINQLKDLIGVP